MGHLHPASFKHLLNWIFTEYNVSNAIFSIPSQCFYRPANPPICSTTLFNRTLAVPLGPAAGPHTQMAQNIITAWLCGSRFIELKTVQIQDELDICRPCIDMTDEGYNVEWSQELKIPQSIAEYTKAWVVIHVLKHLLSIGEMSFGTIFNMSVGYDLKGIQSKPMRTFLTSMIDASTLIEEYRHVLATEYPKFADIDIPKQISNNVTVSTMHGCPPDEIQRIGEYLLQEYGLHVMIKLNPTLLGKNQVIDILRNRSGFRYIDIPDSVFEKDLGWDSAMDLIRNLVTTAGQCNRDFGIKLSNTLGMRNVLKRLPGDELYMSGRALFPVTVNLFNAIQKTHHYRLHVSYCGGADACSLPSIIAAGALPVTAASDPLKPGGYMRFLQYIESLENTMRDSGCDTLRCFQSNVPENLAKLAQNALADPRYKKNWFENGLPKLDSSLPVYDCITAPCTATCPAHQNPPGYIRGIASDNLQGAFLSILERNPLPGMTGYICPQECARKCTRNAYDRPIDIRGLKRHVRDHIAENPSIRAPIYRKEKRVAVIGAGPAGLSAAAFLADAGISSTIFEASGRAGGMPCLAPEFRIPADIIQSDVDEILRRGVTIEYNHPVTGNPAELLSRGFDAVFFAPGFQVDIISDIPGSSGPCVLGVLEFLALTQQGETWQDFRHAVIIGGGNTAIDAARTVTRLTKQPATVLYRRTRNEMPAWKEEIDAFLAERNRLIELVTPVKINRKNGFPLSVTCVRNRLDAPGSDGRPKPVPIDGSLFELEADLVITAIGQKAGYKPEFIHPIRTGSKSEILVDEQTGRTSIAGVFAGGDAVRGPSSIIQAVADGYRAACAISAELFPQSALLSQKKSTPAMDHQKIYHARSRLLFPEKAGDYHEGKIVYSKEIAKRESSRCMQCDLICDRCVDVCPNRANIPVAIRPGKVTVQDVHASKCGFQTGMSHDVELSQERQIIHIDEWCNSCGNCTVFCTHIGEPFNTKPRFFLKWENFIASSESAWFCRRDRLVRRWNDTVYELTLPGPNFRCRVGGISIDISRRFQVESVAGSVDIPHTISLIPAAEMMFFWDALQAHPICIS
jgi:putative selenate reductase